MKLLFINLILSLSVLAAESKIIGLSRVDSNQALSGTVLVSELGCMNCHGSEHNTLSKKGPQLNLLGNRVRANWLREFLKNPQKLKPGTTMPDLFHGDQQDEENIEALVHFLSSDQIPEHKMPKIYGVNQRTQGEIIYHKVGCVNCHGPNPMEQSKDVPHFLSLGKIKQKYSFASLTRFLEKPLEHRPSGRMPDFQLGGDNASHIAAYLFDRKEMSIKYNPAHIESLKTAPDLVAKGKVLFENMGCANCHDRKETQTKLIAPAWNDLKSKSDHCMSQNGKIRYSLKPEQSQAIQTVDLNLINDPNHKLQHTLVSLNCISCHKRDDFTGPLPELDEYFHGEESLGDEGRFPPNLTGVGRKLTSSYMKKILNGQGGVREHLETKMPIFGREITKILPELFEANDLPKTEAEINELKGGDPETGKLLIGSKALNCIMCHNFKDRQSTGIPAPNIAFSPDRLRPAWFIDNLINPAKVRPGTLMPSFWPNGKSTQSHILGGDTQAQIASIYAYLKTSKDYPEGYPPPKSKFELFPNEKAIILRTFMKHSGTHSIVVGDPAGLNYAYNGDGSHLAVLWNGRFLDTYNKNINRFADFDEPLGDTVNKLSTISLLVPKPDPKLANMAPSKHGFEFTGYRLTEKGRPVFMLQYQNAKIEDSLHPDEQGKSFTRKIKISGEFPELHFHPTDLGDWKLIKKTDLTYQNGFAQLKPQNEPIILEMEYELCKK